MTGPRAPRATAEIDCAPAGYPGWQVTVVTNPRRHYIEDIFSNDHKRIYGALLRVLVQWNFTDSHGVALPQPKEHGSLEGIPGDLIGYLLAQYMQSFVDRYQKALGFTRVPGPPAEVFKEISRDAIQRAFFMGMQQAEDDDI